MTTPDADFRAALAIGQALEHSLHRTVTLLQKAHGAAKVDGWLSLPGIELIKYAHLFRANREGGRARTLLADFRDELDELQLTAETVTLSRAGDPQFRLDPGSLLADVFADSLADLWMEGRIERRRRKANIALVRVRSVLRALERPRGEA